MAPQTDDHSDSNNGRAARPGVQYITSDQAARFDERITEKRNKNDSNNSNMKKSAGPRMIVDVDELSARPSQEQADVEAKKRARASAGTAKSAVARVPPSRRMEEDRQAKERAKSAFRKPAPASQATAVSGSNNNASSLETLDRDIEAKNQARRSITAGKMTAKKPPARATLSTATIVKDDNADTTAKNRARPSNNNGPAMIPGVYEVKDHRAGANNSSSGNSTAKKDIVFGGTADREVSSQGLDANDRRAKQNAAAGAPRYINIDDNTGGHLSGKKMKPGADASYGGSPNGNKKMNGRPGGASSNAPVYIKGDHDPETALYGKMRGTGTGRGGPGGPDEFGEFGTMEMTNDDVEFQHLDDNKLAVATAITEEEEDDTFIPAAVEFDPDAKPPLYKNRRFRLYGFLSLLLLLVAVVAIIIPTKVTNQSNHANGPTMAPTTYRESLGIQEQLEKFVGSTKLYDADSPHSKALDWLLHDDALQLSQDAENLLQRYIVALFYFHTSAAGPWRSCNPPNGNQTAECMYQNMLSVYPTITYEPVPSVRWLSDRSECEWVGVICEEERVVMLQIMGQSLTGGLPVELSHLAFLRSINFAWNELSGPLPKTIAATMKQLTNIELHSNFFNGTFPSEFLTFENLVRFNLGTNQLTGTLSIPSDASSESLNSIFLFENQITGSIPTEISRLSSLSYLRLSKNPMTGSIPSEIGLLSDLQEIWFHQSSLSGTIPTEIGVLGDLQDFRVQFSGLSGEIPDELYDLASIDRIDLFDTNITGTISTLVGQLTTLDVLRIRGTKLEGQIPTELGLLTELVLLWVHHNGIGGTVPDEVCQLRNQSFLVELVADCSASEQSGFAPVACPDGCCTQCCDPDTQACVDMLSV